MTQSERQEAIFTLIQRKECCTVKELTSMIYASPATIRRDLHALEHRGLIRLQYGNILLMTEKSNHLPLELRSNQEKEPKRAIARYAAGLLPANTSVMLDSSSSALYMADYIKPDRGITVFTNCIKAALKLSENKVRVYLMGGMLDDTQSVTNGAWTLENISSINVDYLFFSSRAMDDQGVISGQTQTGIQMRKYMIAHSKKQYFLCNSEKTHQSHTFHLCNTSSLTGVITDTDLSYLPNTKFVNINEVRGSHFN